MSHHMQPEDLVFTAATVATSCQNGTDQKHANSDYSSGVPETRKQTSRIDNRGWKREEHDDLIG